MSSKSRISPAFNPEEKVSGSFLACRFQIQAYALQRAAGGSGITAIQEIIQVSNILNVSYALITII